jgi:hypothetical protein
MAYDNASTDERHGGAIVPRDGEGIPPNTDDGLLAQVIPLRRRGGEGAAPQILADEPRRPADERDGVFDPPEHPSVPAGQDAKRSAERAVGNVGEAAKSAGQALKAAGKAATARLK